MIARRLIKQHENYIFIYVPGQVRTKLIFHAFNLVCWGVHKLQPKALAFLLSTGDAITTIIVIIIIVKITFLLERGWRNRYDDWIRVRLQGSSGAGRVKNFLFTSSWRQTLGPTQPPFHWVPAKISPGEKRLGREADYLPPTSAEVKKTCVYTSSPPYVFMAQYWISRG
jgi:hypothetical protein